MCWKAFSAFASLRGGYRSVEKFRSLWMVRPGIESQENIRCLYQGARCAGCGCFSTGSWYVQRSQMGFMAAQFGQNGDVPVPGDYDNDGKHDLAVFRGGNWYVMRRVDNQFVGVTFGTSTTDVPIPAAYLP